MNKETKYALGGLVVGGFLVWGAIMSINNTNNTGMMNRIGLNTSTPRNMMQNSNTMDQHFIEQMIPHHEDAITMAQLAQTKASRPEVKQLAESIIISQSREIDQMKEWYKSWYGRDLPTGEDVMNQHGMMGNNSGMHMGTRGDESDMLKLELATDFDVVFVEQMIPHHQMAVMMASMLKNGTKRPEMKKLADDIISAQTSEIDQMREWLKSW